MRLEDLDGLVNLALESVRRLEEVEELSVVHLQEHASDLSGKLGLGRVDEGIKTLADHVLLHLRAGSSKGGGGKGVALLGRLLNGGLLHGGVAHVLLEVEVLALRVRVLACVGVGVGCFDGGRSNTRTSKEYMVTFVL